MGSKGGEEVAAMVRAFQSRRDYVVYRLEEIPGVKVAPIHGAFYALPDLRDFVSDPDRPDRRLCVGPGFGPLPDVDALCQYVLQEYLLALVPGDAFGAPTCVRISYAASM